MNIKSQVANSHYTTQTDGGLPVANDLNKSALSLDSVTLAIAFAGKIYLRDFRLFVTIIDHYR